MVDRVQQESDVVEVEVFNTAPAQLEELLAHQVDVSHDYGVYGAAQAGGKNRPVLLGTAGKVLIDCDTEHGPPDQIVPASGTRLLAGLNERGEPDFRARTATYGPGIQQDHFLQSGTYAMPGVEPASGKDKFLGNDFSCGCGCGCPKQLGSQARAAQFIEQRALTGSGSGRRRLAKQTCFRNRLRRQFEIKGRHRIEHQQDGTSVLTY